MLMLNVWHGFVLRSDGKTSPAHTCSTPETAAAGAGTHAAKQLQPPQQRTVQPSIRLFENLHFPSLELLGKRR